MSSRYLLSHAVEVRSGPYSCRHRYLAHGAFLGLGDGGPLPLPDADHRGLGRIEGV